MLVVVLLRMSLNHLSVAVQASHRWRRWRGHAPVEGKLAHCGGRESGHLHLHGPFRADQPEASTASNGHKFQGAEEHWHHAPNVAVVLVLQASRPHSLLCGGVRVIRDLSGRRGRRGRRHGGGGGLRHMGGCGCGGVGICAQVLIPAVAHGQEHQ